MDYSNNHKKKILIVGSGTAGAIAYSLIKKRYGEDVSITVVYDKENESIGVGEGTIPGFNNFVESIGISKHELIKNVGATIKLGILFKNWLSEKSFFHGFLLSSMEEDLYRIKLLDKDNTSPFFYGLANNDKLTTLPFSEHPTTTVPKILNKHNHSYHIDGVLFSKYIKDLFKNQIEFVESKIAKVNCNKESIESVELEGGRKIFADFYIDCSGFAKILIKHFQTPQWIDVSEILPIDRAIIQQVKNLSETPSYTLSEATKDGWIWQIPVSRRYGIGYLYSSKFTTNEEAKTNFNKWLKNNHNTELSTERIVNYKSGYCKTFCANNWAAIGLSSGFVEPLEATGIQMSLEQVKLLLDYNILFDDNFYNKIKISEKNYLMYKHVIEFIDFHYCTKRTDSDFWIYKTTNKTISSKLLEEKCGRGILTSNDLSLDDIFQLESYIAIGDGLNLIDKNNTKKSFEQLAVDLLDAECKLTYLKNLKKEIEQQHICHRLFLNLSLTLKPQSSI